MKWEMSIYSYLQEYRHGTEIENDRQSGPLEQESDEESPLMFHMVNEKHGEFCQWYPSTFFVYKHEILEAVGQDRKEGDGYGTVWFSSAEQFMMYSKATRFGDHETQRRVMETKDPKEQKRLGRQTAGFTHAGWDEVKSAVVELANTAKFGQNAGLRTKLLATGDRLLCEAAPDDRVWGIGFDAKRAMAMQDRWGENRLGKALMAVREKLRKEVVD